MSINAGDGGAIGTTAPGAGALAAAVVEEGGADSLHAPPAIAATIKIPKAPARKLRAFPCGLRVTLPEGRAEGVNSNSARSTGIEN